MKPISSVAGFAEAAIGLCFFGKCQKEDGGQVLVISHKKQPEEGLRELRPSSATKELQ